MTEKEDYLDVDYPLIGQNYTCISFVSPEKILAKKNVWMFNQFLKEFSEKHSFNYNELKNNYDDFIYTNENKLEKEFQVENDNQTTVRGVKVRGCFDTRREAEVRAEVLRRINSNHHIFVGQVGYWLPWDPNADNIGDQQYQESELNNLVGKHKENQEQRDMFYEELKAERIKDLEKDNKQLKDKNKLQKEKEDAERAIKDDEEKANKERLLKETETDVVVETETDVVVETETDVVEEKNTNYSQFEDADPWMKRHQ